VLFHDGNVLKPSDVEYSFERELVQDRSGGPQWMLYYPLLGVYGALDPVDDPNFGSKIDNAVQSSDVAGTVTLNLVINFPTLTLLQILSQTWSSVVEKSWAAARGDFDGNWAAGWQVIYGTWHNPAVSFIEGAMMGTGPFKFDYWVPGTSYSIVRFVGYWDGWPARVKSGSDQRIGDFLERVTWNLFADWTVRRARFLAGDADFTSVDRQYRDQVLGQSGVRCYYPFNTLSVDAMFFTFDINTQSPYLGVPGGLPPGTFAENGIPPNFFSDINVRKAFAYVFDYNTWLSAAYLGEGSQPSDPVIPGVLYDNPSQVKYYFDLGIATTYFRMAWGGALWANGMSFTITYNSGNVARETAAVMLMNNINSLNPKFHVGVQEVPWGSTYLPQMVQSMLPVFIIGWLADYPDPDNFVFPFMHSQGTFAAWQLYSNPTVDSLITQGISTADGPARQQIYYNLQSIYYNDAPSVTILQPVGRHFERDWVRNWYYNPIYPGFYFYHAWKAETHLGDANNDGVVDVLDGAVVSASWTKPGPSSPLGPLGYKPQADLSGGSGGNGGGGSGFVVGISDGKVTVVDQALISSYWDGPPQGPDHP
jgi:peptide/nickel transport system substrate-binding protein